MSYQGNIPASNFESPKKDRFTGISGTTCSLTYAVSSVADIIVWVNSVKQDFTNYSVSGNTLTLGGTLVSADIVEVTYIGRTFQSVNPSASSVNTSQLADDAVTLSKMASGTDGNIISYDASGNPVAVATGNNGQVLTSAGAGSPPTFSNAPSGELVFIDKNISTGSATYATMDNVFTSTYQNYVAFIGLSTSVENDVFFNYRDGASGSTSLSEDASYKYAGITARSSEATSTSNYGNNSDKVQITHGSNANDNRLSAFTATMYFYTPYSTSFFARSTYTYFYQNSSAVVSGGAGGILYAKDSVTTPMTGFSFYTSGGTIDETNIRVYGIKDN